MKFLANESNGMLQFVFIAAGNNDLWIVVELWTGVWVAVEPLRRVVFAGFWIQSPYTTTKSFAGLMEDCL